MPDKQLSGGAEALLGEYKRVTNELLEVLNHVTDTELVTVVDHTTMNGNCKSIQTILTHIVCSGFGYTVFIEKSMGISKKIPRKKTLGTIQEYKDQLTKMIEYCELFFMDNPTIPLEEYSGSTIINVPWGQRFDVEQIMEHAIVHVMRHKRQIEKFIRIIRNA